jgi:polynucleotide 5'-kinase involved in rRNA processing
MKKFIASWDEKFYSTGKVENKSLKQMVKKLRLIIIEGPAGSGKTTLSHCLYNYLQVKGYKVGMIPEFSDNEIGLTIKNI